MWWATDGSWGGLGWFWVPIGAVMMIGCMLMMFMMMGGMMGRGGHGMQHGQHHGQQPESAEQILAGRFARGEIDERNSTTVASSYIEDDMRARCSTRRG